MPFKGGTVYLGSQFQKVYSIVTRPCSLKQIIMKVGAGGGNGTVKKRIG